MSISQRALILIRLDARRGEDVKVDDLAAHMNLSAATVCTRILELAEDGYVEPVRQAGGQLGADRIVAVRLVARVPSCG